MPAHASLPAAYRWLLIRRAAPRGLAPRRGPSAATPLRHPHLTRPPRMRPVPGLPASLLGNEEAGAHRARAKAGVDSAFVVAGLHRFGEALAGSAFSLILVKNMLQTASYAWALEAAVFQSRLAQIFYRAAGTSGKAIVAPRHPWYGGGKVLVSSVYGRDPFLLTQWARIRMSYMRLFAHRRFLRLLATFLRPYVALAPAPGKILGFNLVVTGKISVTGNAMSRTMHVRHGKASINNLRHHASSSFALIRTKTGCLGLNMTYLF